jgi:molecular chaperone DnaK (HSP70)
MYRSWNIDECPCWCGSTSYSRRQEAVEKFFGKKPNCEVNPDEVVAIGAAIR